VWLHSGTGIVVVASRVILNGVDVTNASTDFSAYENAQLEIVFTRHPARIAGTVTDTQGQICQSAVGSRYGGGSCSAAALGNDN
jgi:hypothetical protein